MMKICSWQLNRQQLWTELISCSRGLTTVGEGKDEGVSRDGTYFCSTLHVFRPPSLEATSKFSELFKRPPSRSTTRVAEPFECFTTRNVDVRWMIVDEKATTLFYFISDLPFPLFPLRGEQLPCASGRAHGRWLFRSSSTTRSVAHSLTTFWQQPLCCGGKQTNWSKTGGTERSDGSAGEWWKMLEAFGRSDQPLKDNNTDETRTVRCDSGCWFL